MGSRLFGVTEINSNRTDTRDRLRATLRWVVRLVIISIVGCWLFFYLDSIYQRRRAEALFSDLKALNFATAGFPEVRDIMVRYGGGGLQPKLEPRLPDLGDPMIDEHGNVTYPYRLPYSERSRTPQNCTFLLQIMTALPRIPILDRTAQFLYTSLPYIGVRSWIATAFIRVRNGKLVSSQAGVLEFRMERFDSSEHRYLVPLGYWVETRLDPTDFYACRNQPYRVNISHPRGKFPADTLDTCLLQSAGAPTKRAFDVNLSCLDNPFRNCRFDELAPLAWADYSAKNGDTGTGDPHK
ncbi:MAG TPA: hypothetical protein VMU05_16275 [Dongiaceae bacterium]|nr:hypothetical protein [Dongiaceae bacterium]